LQLLPRLVVAPVEGEQGLQPALGILELEQTLADVRECLASTWRKARSAA